MKIPFSLIIVLFCFTLRAQQPQINFLNVQQNKLLKSYVQDSLDATSYFVLLDMNDCINCNLPFKLLINSGKISQTNAVLVISNLSKSKIEAFRKEFEVKDSFRITTDSLLVRTLYSFLKNTQSNAIFSYKYAFVVKSLPLKVAANNNNFKQLEIGRLQITNSTKLKNDDFFYSSLSQTVVADNKILAVVGPKAKVFSFDTNSIVNHVFSFNDTFLIKTAYPIITSHYHDSVRKSAYNSIDSVIKFYYQDIKPLGLDLLKLNAVFAYKNDIYISGSISIPITTEFDKISFAPGLFTFVFNSQLEIKSIKEYQLDIDTASGPVDFYGFMVPNPDTLLINVLTFNEKKFNPYFLGNWVNENNFYRFKGLNKSVILPNNELVSAYFKEIKQLVTKFMPVNDSLIAFNYLPYVLNLKNSTLIRTFNQTVKDGYVPYTLKLCDKINLNESTYYVLIEKVQDKSYVSVTDLLFNRKQIFALPASLNRSESFFIMNNYLCAMNITDEGTIINKIALAPLVK